MSIEIVRAGSKVLDIGCATGFIAKRLLNKNCETWGVDFDKNAIKKAKRFCKKTIVRDLDEIKSLPFPKKYFDYVLLMDVIEHLRYPEKVLRVVKSHLKKGGKIIISVPNVAHASMRLSLLAGNFNYNKNVGGILDNTHYHFYTKKSFEKTLVELGFRILDIMPTNGMTKVPLLRKFTDRLSAYWQYRIACIAPTLFSYQFMAIVEPL